MKFSVRNIYALIIYQLEFLVSCNCMRKFSTAVCRAGFSCCHRNDLIGNELPVIIEANTEEIRILRFTHIITGF